MTLPKFMTTIEKLYRDFCDRMANECEAEANRYDQHPEIQSQDQQFVRVLREKCKQFRQQARQIDSAYGSGTKLA